MCNKYKKLLGVDVWSVDYVKGIEGVEDAYYNGENIYAKDQTTGGWYKTGIEYTGEDEPEFSKLKPWELDRVLLGEEESYIESDSNKYYDEIEDGYDMNSYYVNDDIYGDY